MTTKCWKMATYRASVQAVRQKMLDQEQMCRIGKLGHEDAGKGEPKRVIRIQSCVEMD